MSEEPKGQSVTTVPRGGIPQAGPDARMLRLDDTQAVDVTGLSDDVVNELKQRHAGNLIELQKAVRMRQLDLDSMGTKLTRMNETIKEASKENLSATITNVQEDALGRTETIIGNTDSAKAGKLSDRQAGIKSNHLIYVIIAAVTIIIVALIMGGR